jgi:hypothetical protein
VKRFRTLLPALDPRREDFFTKPIEVKRIYHPVWMMRQVRVCERDETTQYRVFECVRCRTEVMWTQGGAAERESGARKGSRSSSPSRLAPIGSIGWSKRACQWPISTAAARAAPRC